MARSKDDDEGGASPTLGDRLLAAVLAPLFFNVTALGVALAYMGRRPLRTEWFRDFLHMPRLVLVFTVFAAVVGFISGTRGFASFLGHSFYTHTESQRSPLFTAMIWTAVAILAYDFAAIF